MKFPNQHKTILTNKKTLIILQSLNLYGLPIVHQSSQIKETVMEMKTEYNKCSRLEDLKMRPIVGGQFALPTD